MDLLVSLCLSAWEAGEELDVWRAGIRPVIYLFPLCLSLDLGVKGEEGGK